MKNQLHTFIVILLMLAFSGMVSAQNYHLQEGFVTNAPPAGWLLTNVAYSTTHNNGLYTGTYSAKMKPNESFIMFKALNTAAILQFYVKVRDTSSIDDFHLIIEKSYNKIDWVEVAKDPCNMENDSVFQLVNVTVNDAAPELYLRFHAVSLGGTATLGLCYIDDISVTKLDVSPNDATLTDLSYNGISLIGFTAATLVYNIEVPYSVEQVALNGIPNNPASTLTITNPTNLRGYEADRTGTVKVTSADGTNTQSYKIIFTVSDYIYRIGFELTGDGVMPLPGWRGGYTYTSTTIPMGNHGLFTGNAAMKFMRGQPDKIGYLNTAKYIKSDTLSFWLAVSDPDGVEQLAVAKKVNGGVSIPLDLITSATMSGEWKLFTYPIQEDDSTEIILTPTLTAEGITRVWIDDLSLKGKKVSGLSVPESKQVNLVSVYPNPTFGEMEIDLKENNFEFLTVYTAAGCKLSDMKIDRNTFSVDFGNLPTGFYIMTFTGDKKTATVRFVKK